MSLYLSGEVRNWEIAQLVKCVLDTQVQGPEYGSPGHIYRVKWWHMHAYHSSVGMSETGVSWDLLAIQSC